ncbi:unnamed protein product [Prunus armeniaca]
MSVSPMTWALLIDLLIESWGLISLPVLHAWRMGGLSFNGFSMAGPSELALPEQAVLGLASNGDSIYFGWGLRMLTICLGAVQHALVLLLAYSTYLRPLKLHVGVLVHHSLFALLSKAKVSDQVNLYEVLACGVTSQDRLRRSTIFFTLSPPLCPPLCPYGFVFGNSRATSQWFTLLGIALTPTRLTSEFP